jgi:hypothetical protein
VVFAIIWMSRSEEKYPDMWGSFQRAKTPVLICLGAHDIPVVPDGSPGGPDSFYNQVLHKSMIPVDDASVITAMASLLGKQGIPFRVAGADQTSLSDLRRQPVILIGAADNKWTLRLTQDLRYRVEFTPPAPNQKAVAYIVDSKQPAATPWTTDFSVPMSAWKGDYAIVARMDDPITGVPVLIDAGLGNDGSLAASELITSGALKSNLQAEPSCRDKNNFEAVIETNMIDERPGPSHVLRLQCW